MSLVVQVTGSAVIVAAFAAGQAAGIAGSSRLCLAAGVIGSLALAAGALLGSHWGFWPWRACGPRCRSSACVRHFVAQGDLSVTDRAIRLRSAPRAGADPAAAKG